MSNTLLQAVRDYADKFADSGGIAQTPVAGLMTIRSAEPTGIIHAITKPLVCLVLQGRKNVTIGVQTFDFGAGDSLLITGDLPMASQITQASVARPYFSMVLELDRSVIAELIVQIGETKKGSQLPATVEPTDVEVANAALRLMRLLDRPESVPILREQMIREMHYWLLVGQHGAAIRNLGWPDGDAQRVAKAVEFIRAEYASTLLVDDLAALVGMSPSSFYAHFKSATSLSPLQFQKQLRLIEARRLMIAEGVAASHVAFEVGYESVSQFTREYRRMFGLPPAKDRDATRTQAEVAA